jgi:hypothetical protein
MGAKKSGLGGRLGLDVFCALPRKAGGVEGEVFINKSTDEKVAVVVAGLHAQGKRGVVFLCRLFQGLRVKLLGQKAILSPWSTSIGMAVGPWASNTVAS